MLLSLIGGGRRADSVDKSVYGNFWFEPTGPRTVAGPRVTAITAVQLPTVWACVSHLAKSFAVMPFCMYELGAKKRTMVKSHWLARLFTKRPNKFQTPFEFRMMLMGHLALRGNAFCQITANSRGEITDLLPLHPDRMMIEMLPNGIDYRYRYVLLDGTSVYYTRQDIWHLRGLSSDGIVGASPIEIAREAIGEGLAMQAYSSRFFANDAKPGGGWIEFPGTFADKAARQNFKESWREGQGGANQRRVAVLDRGMKFHELGMSNDDAQFVEARREKVSEIARIWGIPPHKVGDLSKATFSNIEQQSIEFWTDTMLPWAELWESSIECFLLGETDEYEIEFDMRRMLRGDSVARTAYYQGGINAGWLVRNEARAAEGFDPIDGLDEPLVALNMVSANATPEEIAARKGSVGPDNSEPKPMPAKRESRLMLLLSGNAARMARRLAAGQEVPSELLSEAMAVEPPAAEAWLARSRDGLTEESVAASLIELATKGDKQ